MLFYINWLYKIAFINYHLLTDQIFLCRPAMALATKGIGYAPKTLAVEVAYCTEEGCHRCKLRVLFMLFYSKA